MAKDKAVVQKYNKTKPWGMSICIDLYDCNPKTIRSAAKIKKFVKDLCVFIDMKRFGETVVVKFGDNPRVTGYSMTQLIQTSLISGHFADQTNAAYLDVFSCKAYPPEATAEFAKKFFEAKKMEVKVNFRK